MTVSTATDAGEPRLMRGLRTIGGPCQTRPPVWASMRDLERCRSVTRR